MRIKLTIAMLSLAAAFAVVALVPPAVAQTTPPAAAEKPAAPRKRAAPAEEGAPQGVSIAEKAQKCLKLREDPQARLNCYDAAVPPQPNPKAPPAQGIRDCRYIVDQNDRLGCFDGFAEQIPKFTH
jgi:hypothetical protein